MTRQQIVEEFQQMNAKTKISLLRELLDKAINDELREDISDYLLAVQAKKEGGYTSFDKYHKKRMAQIGTKRIKE